MLLTRSPLSRNVLHPEGIHSKRFVRLACLRHTASVHPEPGSNSPKQWPELWLRRTVWLALWNRQVDHATGCQGPRRREARGPILDRAWDRVKSAPRCLAPMRPKSPDAGLPWRLGSWFRADQYVESTGSFTHRLSRIAAPLGASSNLKPAHCAVSSPSANRSGDRSLDRLLDPGGRIEF